MKRKLITGALIVLFSIGIMSCEETTEPVVETNDGELIEVQEVEETPEPEVVEEPKEEVEPEVPEVKRRPLEEKKMSDKTKLSNLQPGNYTAESVTTWALNASKDGVNNNQILIRATDRYQLFLEMEQKGEDILWFMTSYNNNERSDYILVASSVSSELASFKWDDSDRVDVDKKVLNKSAGKTYNLNERYQIDSEGKFSKIVR